MSELPRFFCVMSAALVLCACAPAPTRTAPSGSTVAPFRCAPTGLPSSSRFTAVPYQSGLPRQAQWRDGFDLADMNGDGHLDLLHGPPRKGRALPFIFLGDGKGGFGLWNETHFPPLPYDYGDIKAADFNGDGRLDIALTSHLRGLVTLINEGGGHYAPWGEGLGLQPPGKFPDKPLFTSRSIAITDWNSDGKPDLLALNEGPSRFVAAAGGGEALAIFLNRGGYWQRMATTQPLSAFGDALAVGDIDADGHLDALIGTQVSGARTLLQIGDADSYRAEELRSLPPQAAVTAVALQDIDRDGRADVFNGLRMTTGEGYCSALQRVRMGQDGETAELLWQAASADAPSAIAIADIDQDGAADLAVLRRDGAILLFAGTAHGFVQDVQIVAPPDMNGCQGFDARLVDVDEDQTPELIVSYAGDDLGDGSHNCPSGGGIKTWRLARR